MGLVPRSNPHSASKPMKTVFLILLVAAVLIVGIDKLKKRKKREEPQEHSKPVEPTPPLVPHFPQIRLVRMDDAGSTLHQPSGSDTNWAQDQALSIALDADQGAMPLAIAATCGRKTASIQGLQYMLKAAAINIPVLQGHTKYEEAPSEFGRWIIKESKKGRLDFDIDGPVCDLAWAMKNGAHIHNIYGIALLGTTWNAQDKHIDRGLPARSRANMKASADYVRKMLGDRLIEIRDPEYKELLYRKNLPPQYRDTSVLIEGWRKYSFWDVMNTPFVLQNNREYNGSQYDTGGLRAADVKTTQLRYGIKTLAELFARAEHGFQIIQARQDQGAKRTLADKPDLPPENSSQPARPPVTEADFNLSVVDMGGYSNPLSFPETVKLTAAKVGLDTSEVNHARRKTWPGVEAEHEGRMITVNSNVTLFYVENGKTKGEPYEYLRVGATKMDHAGALKASPSIQIGDTVGIMDSTIYRRGDLQARQGIRERSNVRFVKVV